MKRLTVQMILLAILVTVVACNPPPVPLDDIVIEKTFTPERCDRLVKSGDFVRYHYIGTFPDGKKFDSRLVQNALFFISPGLKPFASVGLLEPRRQSRTNVTCSFRPSIVNITFAKHILNNYN